MDINIQDTLFKKMYELIPESKRKEFILSPEVRSENKLIKNILSDYPEAERYLYESSFYPIRESVATVRMAYEFALYNQALPEEMLILINNYWDKFNSEERSSLLIGNSFIRSLVLAKNLLSTEDYFNTYSEGIYDLENLIHLITSHKFDEYRNDIELFKHVIGYECRSKDDRLIEIFKWFQLKESDLEILKAFLDNRFVYVKSWTHNMSPQYNTCFWFYLPYVIKNEMLKHLIVNYTNYLEKNIKGDEMEFTYRPTYKFEGWLQRQEDFLNADFLSGYSACVRKDCLNTLKEIGCDYLSESNRLLFMVN